MKTHMNNTQSFKLHNDVVGQQHFRNHQKALHSDVKPLVQTKRKSEIKIIKNNKVQINNNPKQHVNKLFTNLYKKQYKSTLDNQALNYESQKILLANKTKKNKYQLFAKKQHEKELENMNKRIKNCKNLQQRKKDNTDPIVNPTYFIKDGKQIGNITINQYSKKILGMNRPQSGLVTRNQINKKTILKMPGNNASTTNIDAPSSSYFGSVPNYAKQRPNSANMANSTAFKDSKDDLPGCTFKDILNHIVNKKLFKDVQMKVLYVRLCHRYGQQNVDNIWQNLMDELQK